MGVAFKALAPSPRVMGDCIFCKITAGESPSYKIWEDDFSLAFLDLFPLSRGHLLVVPKRHVDRLTDLPKEHHGAMLGAVAELCRRVERLAPDYNVGVNQGAIAGQIVFHLHFHIIPRYPDSPGFPKARVRLDPADAESLVKILSAQ